MVVFDVFLFVVGGWIDVLMNNVGIVFGGLLVEVNEEEIDCIVVINFCGVVNGMCVVYLYFRVVGLGSCLFNIVSVVLIYGVGGLVFYLVIKFVVCVLIEVFDVEWYGDGIVVCLIMLGFVDMLMFVGFVNV